MATPSPDLPPSWRRLTASARDASAPADLDVRVAVRAQISAHSHEEPENSSLNLLDEVWTAFCARWFDAPIAILAVVVLLMWFEGLDVVSELSLVWQLQGPIISGI